MEQANVCNLKFAELTIDFLSILLLEVCGNQYCNDFLVLL